MKQFIEIITQILAIVIIVPLTKCEIQREMTVIVAPKTVECLYEDIPTNFNIEFEYQVIDGGQGELDINFYIALGEKVFYSDIKSSDNFHRIENEEHDGGNFKFCFDNSISHFNSKTVFFELVTEDPDNPQSENDKNLLKDTEGLHASEFFSLKVEEINDIVNSVHKHLSQARHHQDKLRSFEARDRNIVELNYSRVGFLSIVVIFVMIFVGTLQLYLIKSLFETGNKRIIWCEIGKYLKL